MRDAGMRVPKWDVLRRANIAAGARLFRAHFSGEILLRYIIEGARPFKYHIYRVILTNMAFNVFRIYFRIFFLFDRIALEDVRFRRIFLKKRKKVVFRILLLSVSCTIVALVVVYILLYTLYCILILYI